MPWSTPALRDVRSLVRDAVNASLPGADANVPNSVLRVLSDNQGALCHLTLQYIDWLALQLLPDTAETEWLDRHGQIWLVNSDGSTGRKMATLAQGTASFQGTTGGGLIPTGTLLQSALGIPPGSDSPNTVVSYELLDDVVVSTATASTGNIRCLDAGSFGNLPTGSVLSMPQTIAGASQFAEVLELNGGADPETDDQLRARILRRIRQPPMGGAAYDYEAWALAVPGVTRAWCAPLEMGIGTVTIRFMMDDLRASNGGFPLPADITAVKAYIDQMRPVAVKDVFVEAPIPYPINLRISYLDWDDGSTRASITQSLLHEFFVRASPGQLWYRSWSDEGIANGVGVNAYDLVASDTPMPAPGYMPVLGDITYG
ncbi:baseplate J/gp47 family protein [Bradyrhizobium sp. CCGUVB1N3]|uniref:baseplate J/gp47 family protein n=1 Tax=Bradyrhizobium sp. CCGUVB1N3 TaxID=2949629 RepID=UPI0020B2736F|nr:baseplate J/gp47 family protein [Bradyrhizobium sp. CCGUVB1N3]MCP3475156.1 baseplate J/gp47 family protein [Bradyrhizobium sp. CCGUVB1N3]